MDDREFHDYVQSVAGHMAVAGWRYRPEENVREGTVSYWAELVQLGTGARIVFSRDDSRKKISARAESARTIGNRRESLYGDQWDARATVSQGRDPKQAAGDILRKVAGAAIKASAELDRIEKDHAESCASQAATIAALNASGLLDRELAPNHDRRAHFYLESVYGTVDEHGSVRLDLRSLSRDRALAVLAALAAFPDAAEAAE